MYDEPESLEEKGLQFWKGKGSRHPVDPETDYDKLTQKVKSCLLALKSHPNLNPCHKEVDVLGRRTFDWFLHLIPVCPVILRNSIMH